MKRRSLEAARVAVFAAICALYFVGALPQGVCFCDLEGGSCCGPALDLRDEAEAAAAPAPAAREACCDSCAGEAARRARLERAAGELPERPAIDP